MSAADIDAAASIDESSMAVDGARISGGLVQPGSGSQSAAPPPAISSAQPKRRMVITHDKYMTLQSLIVLHLSSVERETGRGVDRDELIDWYLELKESELQDIEELEYEKELITKMLRKLVKVRVCILHLFEHAFELSFKDNYLIEVKGDVQESLPSIDDESQESAPALPGENVRVYYMVHPSVDTDASSSIP
jgi:DNA replication licensing factor MCM6